MYKGFSFIFSFNINYYYTILDYLSCLMCVCVGCNKYYAYAFIGNGFLFSFPVFHQ